MELKMKQSPCTFCECFGDLKMCLESDCQFHDTFPFMQFVSKLKTIFKIVDNIDEINTEFVSVLMDANKDPSQFIQLDQMRDQLLELSNLKNPDTEYTLIDICDHIWVDVRRGPIVSGEFCIKCNHMREDNFTDVQYWSLIDNDADLYTIDEFIECCGCSYTIKQLSAGKGKVDSKFIDSHGAGFIDYDGHGHYAVDPHMDVDVVPLNNFNHHPNNKNGKLLEATKKGFVTVKPSDIINQLVDLRFTHIVWYNR